MLKSAHSGLAILVGFGFVVGCAQDAATEPTRASSQALTAEEMLDVQFNSAGKALTVTPTATIDTASPYFQSLGTNGRTCNSCHQADQGWTITPASLQDRFDATDGLDPIFVALDGADWPGAPRTTVDDRRNTSHQLLSRGLIRVGLPGGQTNPNGTGRDFRLVSAQSPYPSTLPQLSLFRRPLPTTNLRFASSVNWDGRNTPDPVEVPLITGLKNQANGATTGHAQGLALADGTRLDIANTELTFHTAQQKNTTAGALDAAGATGGAAALLTEPFTRGATRPGSTFNLFDAWTSAPGGGQNADRRRVAAGQAVFNTKTFAGTRTCSGCHSTPNIGTSAAFAFFDVGVSAASRRRPDDQILFKFERLAAKVTNPADAVGTGEMIETTDPGRALITGNWADMNKFKAPSLRGLAARAPYFHDGSVSSVAAVVDHYENHFGIEFTGSEKSDLIMFLESL